MRADKELGRPREAVDIVEVDIVDFFCIIFQLQENGTYLMGFDDPPNDIEPHIDPPIQGFILYV